MNFTVAWLPTAQNRLAELWLEASDQADVTAAADEIDRLLAVNPLGIGESRVSNVRLLIQPPLAVYYDVRLADRFVQVWAVWRWQRQ